MKVYCIVDEQRQRLLCGAEHSGSKSAPIPLRLALAPQIRFGQEGLWSTCTACLSRLDELKQLERIDWRPTESIPEDHYAV